MLLQFWFLWLFIALIVVLVAFTLRKESEEMPRKEILRAVEASTKMGLAEKLFLWVFSVACGAPMPCGAGSSTMGRGTLQ